MFGSGFEVLGFGVRGLGFGLRVTLGGFKASMELRLSRGLEPRCWPHMPGESATQFWLLPRRPARPSQLSFGCYQNVLPDHSLVQIHAPSSVSGFSTRDEDAVKGNLGWLVSLLYRRKER